jgi:hypothetical protein
MKPSFAALLGSGIGLFGVGFVRPALAASVDVANVGAPEHESLPAVEIAVVGDFSNADAVGARIASWFEGQAIATRVSRVPELSAKSVFSPTEAVGVRLWVVLGSPTDARLFFAVQERGGAAARYLVQDVELNGGVDELGLERLAQVASLSAVALWDGNAESTRQDVERRLPGVATPSTAAESHTRPSGEAPPKPRRKDVFHYRGGLAWEASFHGEEGVFWGGSILGGPVWPSASREVSLTARFGWNGIPHDVERQGVTLELSQFTFGLAFGAARRISESFWLSLQLGPTLEAVTCRTKSLADPTLRGGTAAGGQLRPGLLGGVGLWLDLGPVTYALDVNVGAPLVRVHYDIEDEAAPGGREELIVPWAVQPGVSLGVVY